MMIETIGSPNEPTRRFGGRIPGTFRKCDDEMFGEDRMIDLLQCGESAFCCKNRACVVLVCYGACVEKTVCYVFFLRKRCGNMDMFKQGVLSLRKEQHQIRNNHCKMVV